MHTLNFWMGWVACAVALLLFNRTWLKGISRGPLTFPYEVFSYVFFLIAPALNVLLDDYVDRTWFYEDPVLALSRLNWVNTAGLALAAIGARVARRNPDRTPPRGAPTVSPDKMPFLLSALVGVSIILASYNLFVEQNIRISGELDVTIWRYIVIESGGILFSWLVVILVWMRQRQPGKLAGAALLTLLVLLTAYLNFSRGERVGLILVIVMGLQLFHMYVIKLSRAILILISFAGFITFQYITLYKKGGVEAVNSYFIEGTGTDYQLRATSLPLIVFGDLGRADVQAPILSIMMDGFQPLALGRTYARGATLFLPQSLNPVPQDWHKVVVGAEAHLRVAPNFPLLHNSASGRGESRIYGMVGEGLLNFGLLSLAPVFFLFGWLSRKSLEIATSPRTWEWALLSPLIAITPVLLLIYDFDNIVFRWTMSGGIPVLLLMTNRFLMRRAA